MWRWGKFLIIHSWRESRDRFKQGELSRSRFGTSDPLRSRSTGFEAGQRIQFQSRSDLNWLAVLTESVYKLELHAATVIGHDATLTLTPLCASVKLISENNGEWLHVTINAMLSPWVYIQVLDFRLVHSDGHTALKNSKLYSSSCLCCTRARASTVCIPSETEYSLLFFSAAVLNAV